MNYKKGFLVIFLASTTTTALSKLSSTDNYSHELVISPSQLGNKVLLLAQQIFHESAHIKQQKISELYELLESHQSHEIVIDQVDDTQRSALSYILATDSNSVKFLLDFFIHKYHANLYLPDSLGKTPLHYALQSGTAWTLQYLLQSLMLLKNIQKIYAHEDINTILDYKYLDYLPIEDTQKVIVILENSDSPIQNYKVMHRVIDYYQDVTDQSNVRPEFEKIVKVYFSCPATFHTRDFNLLNIVYDMALKLASSINFKMMADVLFQYASSLNQQNDQGETPAHVFVKNATLISAHFFEALHLFQKHGANFVEIKDFAQKTVYDYIVKKVTSYISSEKGVQEVTSLLIKEYFKSYSFTVIS